MVNTRRSESNSSTPGISAPRHQPREDSASDQEESGEESQGDEAWSTQAKIKKGVGVRELRSRFVYGKQRRFSSRSRNGALSRERHSVRVYGISSTMHNNDIDLFNLDRDEEEEIYGRRSRTHIERRTALSLRPISQKCYADSNSDIELRRSKRQRKPINQSWLADDQMHKVGYPSLYAPGYSEEDEESSRDAALQEHGAQEQRTRRSTRRNGNMSSNGNNNNNNLQCRRSARKYTYINNYESEEEDDDLPARTRLSNSRRARRNKINGVVVKEEEEVVIGAPDDEEHVDVEDDDDEVGDEEEEEGGEESEAQKIASTKNADEGVAKAVDVGEEVKPKTDGKIEGGGAKLSANMRRSQYNAKRRAREANPFVHSSSSEQESTAKKGYSLRKREPKPVVSNAADFCVKSSALRTHELRKSSRRRFTTRHRNVSPTGSSSSSDSDARMDKYSKTSKGKNEQQKMKSRANIPVPIGPEKLDSNVRFNTIGGLDGHIRCLKEMILLPMMYPEVFRQFQMQPPRGVLFHGPPGTGKTLMARALANECTFNSRKVSFFMRKGADLLSRWIGESEKQLRLLFEQASEMQPSIIFFDELDGLAPVRSSRQDQVHASIVSTLLALMDGLDNRGEVIVIGATNRIDAIDPALRRPGRFDRELFFPLPSKTEREAILKVHVSKWSAPPDHDLLSYLAESAVGYCGSDLRALCSEAVIQSFRRTYPQVYEADYRLLLNPENVRVEKVDFLRAKSLLVPASHRVANGLGRKLLSILEPLLGDRIKSVFKILEETFQHALSTALSKVKLSPNIRPAQLLLLGENSECGQTAHLAPAILYQMEHIHAYMLDLGTLYREPGRSPEDVCMQVFNEARRNVPSVIYIPNIDNWWSLVSETVKVIFESQLSQLDPNIPILLLATADCVYEELPNEVQNIFSSYRKEVYKLPPLHQKEREAFFRPLLMDSCLKPPRQPRNKCGTPPPLLRAPTPPPAPLSEDQAKKLYEQEEHTLRELRIFLRDICKKLANNKLFFMFTKPVDTEEVPDYTTIIKQPMDLETMMTKVDFHRYECAKDFLTDIELICQNALEYNPAKTSADKQIRHRACSLRDYAYTLIKNEMDSDFEDKCQDIAVKRHKRKASVSKYLPAYIRTPSDKVDDPPLKEDPNLPPDDNQSQQPPDLSSLLTEEDKQHTPSPLPSKAGTTRKRKISSWQRGHLKKRKKLQRDSSINKSKTGDDVEEEKESSDDSKENAVVQNGMGSSFEAEEGGETVTVVDATAPLSINCDEQQKTGAQESPRRRLSDLMSPSELLENPLEFDDIDQALNEEVETVTIPIQCNREILGEIFTKTVAITTGSTLQSLLDLYNQLSRIIKRYSNTQNRGKLTEDLRAELVRFEERRPTPRSEEVELNGFNLSI